MSKQDFIVHVIDEASQHKFLPSGDAILIRGLSSVQHEECDLVQSDAFFYVKAEDHYEAVISVSRTAVISDGDGGKITLEEAFARTDELSRNASFGGGALRVLRTENLECVNETYSTRISVDCHVDRQDGPEKWVEFHRITFFVTMREKVVLLENS